MTSHSKAEPPSNGPLCMTCGTKMRPAGSCFVCEGCGPVVGASSDTPQAEQAPYCKRCARQMRPAGTFFVCEGCGASGPAAAVDPNDPMATYLAVKAQQAALGDQMFELLVKNNWFGALGTTLRHLDAEAGDYVYHHEPRLVSGFHRCYVGGREVYHEARKHKERAIDETVDDDRLKELIEEVLADELEKYSIVLQWHTRHNWDGSDRVLYMYHASEDIPPAT